MKGASMKLGLFCAVAFVLGGFSSFAWSEPVPGAPLVHYGKWGVDLTAGDKTVKPGNDFYRYAEGAWLDKTIIPPDQTATGSDFDVENRAEKQLRAIIDEAAKSPRSPTAKQIGTLYNAFMGEAKIEALDGAPLKFELREVAAASDRSALSKIMAQTSGGFGKSVFSIGLVPDPMHPEINTFYVSQDGLGLPDRDYYLKDGFKPQRDAYLAYIQRLLGMIGYADPASTSKAVLAFETKIAQVSWAAADRRDLTKIFNPMSVSELQGFAPGLNWSEHFQAAGIAGQTHLIVAETSAIQKIAALYASTPLETLKAWESVQIADSASPYLSKRFVDSRFQFRKALTGVSEQKPRWKRGVALIDHSLGEALGREYVAAYFPPASKAKMVDLVANLKAAMAARIEGATWMAPSTKAEALKKLAKMDVQIGYPDKWRDYSALELRADDLYGDVERSMAFEWAYQMVDLGKPVDRKKWGMTPQTVDAYNGGFENKIVFPAGILQPPFFDASADPAVNYGSAGAVIGHEITHGFDDQGRRIDSKGALRDWWTPEDAKRFAEQSARLGAQYDAYEPVPGVHINGSLTMGENIADLGGLLAALDAYHVSLHGKPAPVLDGLTGDQRFFLAYAQSWQKKMRDNASKQQMASDPHSPDKYRVIGPTRNVDAWYAAFAVKDGQYYLAPESRARIW
jgi:putative endopeptidase